MVNTIDEAGSIGNKMEEAKRDWGTYWAKLAKDQLARPLQAITIFDVETARAISSIRIPDGAPERSGYLTANLAYTPDGQYVLSSRLERHQLKSGEHYQHFTFLEFRDPNTGKVVKEISGLHVMQLTAIAVSPDGKYVATGTGTLGKESTLNSFTNKWDVIDNKDPIKLWKISNGEKVMEFGPLRGKPNSLAFSSDSKLLISCQADLEKKETVWLWDIASGHIIERVTTPLSGHEFFGCAISPNGHYIAMPVIGRIYLISL